MKNNWFKRLFGLENEDDEELEYKKNSEPEQLEQPRKFQNIQKRDAKVVYDYPKGHFRFPLIPDENYDQESVVKSNSNPNIMNNAPRQRQVDQENFTSTLATDDYGQSMTRKEYRNRNKGRSHHHVEQSHHIDSNRERAREPINRTTVNSNSNAKKPFRPTEVPSPIYGFKRPEQQEMKLQQETAAAIDKFQEVKSIETESVNAIEVDEIMADSEIEVIAEATYADFEVAAEEEAGQADFEIEAVAEAVHADSEIEARAEDIQANFEVAGEEEAGQADLEIEVIAEATYADFEVAGEEEAGQADLEIEVIAEATYADFEVAGEEEAGQVDLENEAVTEAIHVDSEIEVEAEATHVESEIATEASAIYTNPEVAATLEAPYADTKVEAELEETHQNQPKEINRKRNGVPFNVIMLKKDRETAPNKQPVNVVHNNVLIKPPLGLLDVPQLEVDKDEEWLHEQSQLLDHAFESFNVGAKVVKATKGPAVTQFEVQPELGVRVNKITNLSDDLKLALAARDIRIEAPIPGKSTIGIEVPNRKSRPVLIREILRSPVFQRDSSPLVVALGLDISGQPIVTDLKKMPHGLIAGATGSGKSVCINSIIISLLYKASPHEVKLMLIDPKMVELAPYNGIPHLVSPVITDVKAATAALKWAVEEMERRYELFAHEGVRDISRFNEKVLNENPKAEIMPYLVIIIDELADLMMVSPADVEDAICRIAQKARACGIHLLLATQRPSVDVITGLIKANVPTRIAFSVSSQVDSRTIIDISGAEKLLGRGDMLFLENGSNKPVRIQGNFVKDEEIERVTHFVRKQMKPNYLFVQEELIKQSFDIAAEDELFDEACQFVIEQDSASASSLQRRFRIGYNRAARLVDMMEAQGIVSETKGSKPREVLISKEQLENMQ
ncbi:DNA translocase FtsK [Schinkia sp. CFF1]